MKKIISSILLTSLSFIGFSQQQTKSDNAIVGVINKNDTGKIFTSVEEFPEFQGGQKGLSSFLSSNIKYPEEARQKNIQGKVVVQFVVCTDGSLCDEKIVRSVDSSMDNEVLRVVKSMPAWKPGKQNGHPVKTYYTLPVSFKFQGQEGDTIADARDYLTPKPAPPVVPDSEKIFTSVEVVPKFPGGMGALSRFISDNIKYPQKARDNNIQGRVILKFVVDKDGSIIDIQVTRGLGGGCDEEAIRVMKLMPKWKPGMQNGNPIKVYYTLPISFYLGK